MFTLKLSKDVREATTYFFSTVVDSNIYLKCYSYIEK
jgi:hypothetical protein